jgi:hypothetical protein
MLKTSTQPSQLLRVTSVRNLTVPLASSSVAIKFQNLARLRETHTYPSPNVYEPLPYRDMTSAVNCYFTPERYARTVEIRESPVLAIE